MKKQRMSFRDACDLVPDDLPDGAYFALAHEMAGLDYGDGFAELADDMEFDQPERSPKELRCDLCGKRVRTSYDMFQHRRDKHGKGRKSC